MKLATIKKIYQELNAHNFGGVLDEPVILIKRWRNAIGQFETYENRQPVMCFNPEHFENLNHAKSVIFNEMIHQYVEEFLDID